ncbi:MAG: peptide chain release factor N(5)-glutamine methyltransferase [Muribaculaceae bacterium]|nr:peptide chain release factor N(5)-glutamine methyltransferase [Muribaculaceae bacterium]
MNTNIDEAYRRLRRQLADLTGSDGEATAMTRLIFHALKGWDATGIVIHAADTLSEFTARRIEDILERLGNGEPLQYILGEARFYGMDLQVNPATLIPRPETEELVDLVVSSTRGLRDLRVLDVGTGSGAIAIALSRNMEFPEVTALDISGEALEVARANAARLHARINFLQADIFTWQPLPETFDIIVSNPPYVMESEKKDMERHVLEYEPHTALFVPDDDPLLFYRRIAETGRSALSRDGMIFFEINPLCAGSLQEMLTRMVYTDVETIQDISRRRRFIKARRS